MHHDTMLKSNIMPILAISTLLFSFVVVLIVAFADVQDNQKDLLIYVLGFATTTTTMVLGYYFGSSQGSKDKQKLLDKDNDATIPSL